MMPLGNAHDPARCLVTVYTCCLQNLGDNTRRNVRKPEYGHQCHGTPVPNKEWPGLCLKHLGDRIRLLRPAGEREIGDLTGPVGHCPLCGNTKPKWAITRIGDVATSWACAEDLNRVLDLMQRDYEVTRLEVRNYGKVKEWVELERMLGPS